jgi:hypothetical protein
MSSAYGKSYVLIQPIEKAECWNCTDDSYGSFAVGETLHVLHVYDAFHTTCRCAEEDGRPLFNKDGTKNEKQEGYRFIVNNEVLGRAIGVEMPKQTADLVGDIIAYESGDMSAEQEGEFLDGLRESGLGQKLQGHYGRRM